MAGSARIAPLRGEEYGRVMALVTRGGPADPEEIEPYKALLERLHALTASESRERTA